MPNMKNPASIIKAFAACGWQVVRNAKCRTWSYNPDRNKVYEMVAKNPSAVGYDVGIVKDAQGNYNFEGDTSMMSNDVWAKLGKDFENVKQQYSVANVCGWVESLSGTSSQTVTGEGVIEMELEVEISDFV